MRRLRILGSTAAAPNREAGGGLPSARPKGDWTALFDIRGGARDRALVEALRRAGFRGALVLATEGSPARMPLAEALGPGVELRDRGTALVRALQRADDDGFLGLATVGVGAAVARAFAVGRSIRVDGGLTPRSATDLARAAHADLTLRDPLEGVIGPLVADRGAVSPVSSE